MLKLHHKIITLYVLVKIKGKMRGRRSDVSWKRGQSMRQIYTLFCDEFRYKQIYRGYLVHTELRSFK